MSRTFVATPAERRAVAFWISIIGGTGSGKTRSALRVATGARRVLGGEVGVLDTENFRALEHAPAPGEKADPARGTFEFKHIDMRPPFGPLDFIDAINYAAGLGLKTLIVDSMSDEHEGMGGVLEQHEQLMGNDYSKSYSAWLKPKAARLKLINVMRQLGMNVILCFRSKEKLAAPKKGKEPETLGVMPIGGEEFIYASTASCLLLPTTFEDRGVPKVAYDKDDKVTLLGLTARKRPDYLQEAFTIPGPLCEATGEAIARWAIGGGKPNADALARIEAERLAAEAVAAQAAEAAAALKTQKTMLQDAVLAKVKGDVDKAKALLADIAPGVTSFRELTTLDAIMAAGDKLKVHPEYGDANKREEIVA